MKKLIVGAAAVGAVLALRPALQRRMARKMAAHCGQMRECCGPTTTEREERTEPLVPA